MKYQGDMHEVKPHDIQSNVRRMCVGRLLRIQNSTMYSVPSCLAIFVTCGL